MKVNVHEECPKGEIRFLEHSFFVFMDMPRLVSYNQRVYSISLKRNWTGGEPVGESMGYSYGGRPGRWTESG